MLNGFSRPKEFEKKDTRPANDSDEDEEESLMGRMPPSGSEDEEDKR